MNADTIVYMAEFFTECITKIRSRLVVTNDIISKIDTHFKTENRGMYQRVLDNTFDEHYTLDLRSEDLIDTLNVLKYYYGCTSISNVQEIYLTGRDFAPENAPQDPKYNG